MPPLVQPVDLLDAKTDRPAELRTAEWAAVDQWTRERAFYMAGVVEAETLQEMRGIVRLAATGEAGEFELRQRWEAFLDRKGYTPEPGQEGTIKDLRSLRRFNVALRTNVALLHEWASKENALRPGPLRAQPCWELVRLHQPRAPRDWPSRWLEVGGEIRDGRMIAPKLDLIWAELGDRANFDDALGVDYPPFAWGSGMGRVGVGARECMELGIMTREEIVAQLGAAEARPVHSPNEALDLKPKVSDRDLRDRLAADLGGLARWEKDTLVMTDPNGTRPMTQAELLQTWSQPLPEKFRSEEHPEGLRQKDALIEFVEQNLRFADTGGTDKREDLMRLHARLRNETRPASLWRGMRFPARTALVRDKSGEVVRRKMGVEEFLATIQRDGYGVRPDYPVESWTASPSAADRFAQAEARRGDQWSVVLEAEKPDPDAFKDISALVRGLRGEIDLETSPPVETESEWLFALGVRLAVAAVRRNRQTRTISVRLRHAR